jgi:HTH-type transcriptional regulator, sugar sensing transcriptional regulator
MQTDLLKKLGFSDKSARIYLALLSLGPSSVRKLAENCKLNRGTTYDALKWLQDKGVVNFYNKDTKQTFVAENPEKLHAMVKEQEQELQSIDSKLDKMIPELQALHDKGGDRPVARYYSGKDISLILQDVIDTCDSDSEAMYRIYSTEGIREELYDGFETFSDVRIGKGISVKVIAIGEGGELRGLDERKWLKAKSETPTYIIIYPGKTAYISLNAKKELVGVVIENDGVYQTQKTVFDSLWMKL